MDKSKLRVAPFGSFYLLHTKKNLNKRNCNMTTLNNLQENDEYYTPKKLWEDILEFLPQHLIYLDPFYGSGIGINNLQELGLNAIGSNIDYFEALQEFDYDCILTNSPFSTPILTDFLNHLDVLQKPFILILPITKIFTRYFKNSFRSYRDIQIIIPSSRMSFIDPTRPDNKKNIPSFVSCYVCYKMNLSSDIIFL